MVIVAMPLYLAGFVLSIIGIVQGRTGRGIVLLLACVLLPLLTIGYTCAKFGDSVSKVKTDKIERLSRIEFEDVEGYIDGDYMYCKGKVRNMGTDEATFVKVNVEWLDKDGAILDTDYTFAVSSEGLRPGAAKSFSIMTPADRRMRSYRYHIIAD
ncbi:MAG: FxLYD domain-containing protein [bacterium]